MTRPPGKRPPGHRNREERGRELTRQPARRSHRDDDRGQPHHQTQHPDDRLVRIAGLPSVAELFETGADRVERLYFEGTLKSEVQTWCAALARRRKVYRQVGDDEMRRVAGTAMHGGIVALARPRAIREIDLAAAERWAAAGQSLLIMDGVGNPQNIGAIARTAAFFGVRRMIFSHHPQQAGLSDAAYRVAKGGLEHIEIYHAPDLADALRRLAPHFLVVGTVASRGMAPAGIRPAGKPVALVLGNEEDGLSRETQAACTALVTLPGKGHVQSLNVSAAAAILIFTLLAAS